MKSLLNYVPNPNRGLGSILLSFLKVNFTDNKMIIFEQFLLIRSLVPCPNPSPSHSVCQES